ncbi:MAG: leucyl aminopeptidase [Desulfovibrionaceae bacterium]|nr:leucyl aminopeptidase [Desulfovibrionaceae bacterium]
MNNVLCALPAAPGEDSCIILPTFAEEGPLALAPSLAAVIPRLANLPALRDHDGCSGTLTMCYGNTSPDARILATGMGKRASCTPATLRKNFAAAIKRCGDLRIASPAYSVESMELLAEATGEKKEIVLEECAAAAHMAAYACTAYRSQEDMRDNPPPFSPTSLQVLYAGDSRPEWAERAAAIAEAGALGVKRARDLVNGPPNVVTPAAMAAEAERIAGKYNFACQVLGPDALTVCGMGALLCVAKGSREEPRVISLEYAPPGHEEEDPVIVVGKGITFDSGGISLKPADSLPKMKGDMAGAAAVLGLFTAIGAAPGVVSRRIVGLMPCVENMPGGNAARPGDIVIAMSGKTVEITNTDAEGRLILCDSLAYAQKTWKPAALVDIATLTGACVVALGREAAGLFCDDGKLREHILACGNSVGERFWHMPLWTDMKEHLKSDTADIANAGGREGGAILGAVFLKGFVADSIPWAHLDIAGTGFAAKSSALCPAGGTGFGVRTLYALARSISL